MRRTALAALCITAVATFSLTGCLSGEDKADGPFAGLTGGEIADKAVKATSEADSLRMKGEIQDESAGRHGPDGHGHEQEGRLQPAR